MDAGYQRSKGNKQHLYCKMKSCLDDEYQICTKGRVEKKIYDELFQFLMGPWKKKVDNKE